MQCNTEQPTTAGEESLSEAFAEKREFPRLPFRGRAQAIIFPTSVCTANTPLHDSEVVTSDLSRGGVSILCRSNLVQGQHLMLLLQDKPQLAEVRWCCSVWDGLFAAGCRFHSELQHLDVAEQLTAIDVVISHEASSWDDTESA